MLTELFFDLDGTLTDAGEGIGNCIQHALRSLGEAEADAESLQRCLGPPLWDSFGWLMQRPSKERIEAAVQAYRERFVREGMFENRVYPGIRECVDTLAERGFQLYVVTSKPRVYATKILEHFQLAARFQRIHGPELDDAESTKSRLIAQLLAEEAIAADAAAMIGDRDLDVAGARANGLYAIGALWGYGSRQELADAGAELIAESPAQLLAAMDHRGPQGENG